MSINVFAGVGGEYESNYNVDFYILVGRVADNFEKETGMYVTERAREELIFPAIPYKEHVEQELKSGNITIDFLESSISQVLENARVVSKSLGRDYIGEDSMQESMRKYCPYIFWC